MFPQPALNRVDSGGWWVGEKGKPAELLGGELSKLSEGLRGHVRSKRKKL